MNKIMRLPEVAEIIGVHASTLRRWCEAGYGPRHIRTPRGTYRFSAKDVEIWRKTLEREPSGDKPK